MEKAQITIEYIATISFILVLVIVGMSFATIYLKNTAEITQAKNAAEALKNAINEVNASGPGSVKNIEIVVPGKVSRSVLDYTTVGWIIDLGGVDFNATAEVDVNVIGSMTAYSGVNYIRIEKLSADIVLIGSSMNISPKVSFQTMLPGETRDITFTLTGPADNTATGIAVRTQNDLNAISSFPSFPSSLASGATGNITLRITMSGGQAARKLLGGLVVDTTNGYSAGAGVVIDVPKTLSDLDLRFYGTEDYNSFKQTFTQGNTIYYEVRFYDAASSGINVRDINISIKSPSDNNFDKVLRRVSSSNMFRGAFDTNTGLATGTWTVQVDANKFTNVTDLNTFTLNSLTPSDLNDVNVLIYSNAVYTVHSVDFNQSTTVYYGVRTYDSNGSTLDTTDLNVTVTDSNSIVKQSLTGLSTTAGVYQGNYSLPSDANLGIWTILADANVNNTVSDTNTFTVSAASNCLQTIEESFWPDATYSGQSVSSYEAGDTVYYQLEPLGSLGPMDLNDMTVIIDDSNRIRKQDLNGLDTTSFLYQGSYQLPLDANLGMWDFDGGGTNPCGGGYTPSASQFEVIADTSVVVDVNISYFSNSGYTIHSLLGNGGYAEFEQGQTVYYEVYTRDAAGNALDVNDLNVRIYDNTPTLLQTLTGVSATNGVYQGSYTLSIHASTTEPPIASDYWRIDANAYRNGAANDHNHFEVATRVPKLGDVNVFMCSTPDITPCVSYATSFKQGAIVVYEIWATDDLGVLTTVTDMNVTVTDSNSADSNLLLPEEYATGKRQGTYNIPAAGNLGVSTLTVDGNLNMTVSDSNTFTVTPWNLNDVNIIIYSNAGYTTYATTFEQGDVVYYEVRTYDNLSVAIDVTDLNVTITDGDAVQQQSLTGLSTTSGVYQGSYTLSGSAATNTWTIQANARKNTFVSDTNTFDVTTPAAECATQANCFSHDWNSATMYCKTSGSASSKYCQLMQSGNYWTVRNTASSTNLTITHIKITWTGDTDGDTTVDDLNINNVKRNSASSSSGAWNNVTDFNVNAGQLFFLNYLKWSGSAAAGNMNNETETYTIDFNFLDSSTYTTTGHNPA